MGCDIHAFVEKKHKGKWVMLPPSTYNKKLRERNYKRFARLASVRGVSDNAPLGVPNDASDSFLLQVDSWGVDGHSHSYMPIDEAAMIYLETDYNPDDFDKDFPLSSYFDIDSDDSEEHSQLYRLVFFFDN